METDSIAQLDAHEASPDPHSLGILIEWKPVQYKAWSSSPIPTRWGY